MQQQCPDPLNDAMFLLFLNALHSHCEEKHALDLSAAPTAAAVVAHTDEVVGYLAPAPSVQQQYLLAPEEPRRPTIGGRVVTAQAYASFLNQAGRGAGGGGGGAPPQQRQRHPQHQHQQEHQQLQQPQQQSSRGSAEGEFFCHICSSFLHALGPSEELAKARALVCTHAPPAHSGAPSKGGAAPAAAAASAGGGGYPAASPLPPPPFYPRKDTPDGYWSGKTDDVPDEYS